MAEEQVQTLPSPFPFRPGSIGFAGSKKATNTHLLSGSACWWVSLSFSFTPLSCTIVSLPLLNYENDVEIEVPKNLRPA